MNPLPEKSGQPSGLQPTERPIGLVRGTRDWLPRDFAGLAELQRRLLDQFRRAGYQEMRTPILEFSELHERKSGAGIVANLFEVSGAGTTEVCLRPELTASIVRAYVEAEACPLLPFRVAMAGPVFRFQTLTPGRDREFTQVGVELLGAGGPEADAEIIWLADWSLAALGASDALVRIGHVGLILELLDRSGLPPAATSALVESLSEAAALGQSVRSIEAALERLSGWLRGDDDAAADAPGGSTANPGIDRLFRHLVPHVTGRRSAEEITERLLRKWDLAHSLHEVLARVRGQIHQLADLRGPAGSILEQLDRDYATLAPGSIAALRGLVTMLGHHGVDAGRIELDLGFGRGIGFYTQMIFELSVPTPGGLVEVCGGGRYDGLARVLGSTRDDRGAGFAFGLERLHGVLMDRSSQRSSVDAAARGYLVTTGNAGEILPATIDLATFLRERINVPIVISALEFTTAIDQARELGLGHVVTVGRAIELWNLEDGDVRSVKEGELIDQLRTRLAVFRGDRS
ncbi:MAG: ATP phosphoribosyltransferase regulatory subunit [Isosphaeraceae bacterium]